MNEEQALAEIVQTLTVDHGCHAVILYGSRARGDFQPTSDWNATAPLRVARTTQLKNTVALLIYVGLIRLHCQLALKTEIVTMKTCGTFSKATVALAVLFGISSGALAATKGQKPKSAPASSPRTSSNSQTGRITLPATHPADNFRGWFSDN